MPIDRKCCMTLQTAAGAPEVSFFPLFLHQLVENEGKDLGQLCCVNDFTWVFEGLFRHVCAVLVENLFCILNSFRRNSIPTPVQ